MTATPRMQATGPVCPMCGMSAGVFMRAEHAQIARCSNEACDLQFAWPQLEPDALDRAYRELYYPPSAGSALDRANSSEGDMKTFLHAIEERLGAAEGKRILDHGCGGGTFLRLAASAGAEVVGIEPNADARELAKAAGVPRVYESTAQLIAHSKEKYDWIVSIDSIEHLRTPWSDLAELRPLLATNGHLIVKTPNFESLNSRIRRDKWDQRQNPTHFFYFTPSSLAATVRRAGYSNVQEWRPLLSYSNHGFARRKVQRALNAVALQGGLFVVADGRREEQEDLASAPSHAGASVANGSENGRGFDEWKYFLFGVKLGLGNLKTNRLALGVGKTVGKITQPVNSYSRFPEYSAMERAIAGYVGERRDAKVLDVGSPKLFGFYLAAHYPMALSLTDYSEGDVREYGTLWRGAGVPEAKVTFEVQDVRKMSYADNTFDVVYSMSVLEHVTGDDGDTEGLQEILRVVKPGGLVVISVPYGPRHVAQFRRGFAYGPERNGQDKTYFFQRIYDRDSVTRFLSPALRDVGVVTVGRRFPKLARAWTGLPESVRGVLGVANPVLSKIENVTHPAFAAVPGKYEALYRLSDVYGDAIISGIKRAEE